MSSISALFRCSSGLSFPYRSCQVITESNCASPSVRPRNLRQPCHRFKTTLRILRDNLDMLLLYSIGSKLYNWAMAKKSVKKRGRPPKPKGLDELTAIYEDVLKTVARKGNPKIDDTLAELRFSRERFEKEVLKPLNKTWDSFYRDLLDASMSEIGFISLRPVAEFYQEVISQAREAMRKVSQLAETDPKAAREYSESQGRIISMAPQAGARLKDLLKFQLEVREKSETPEDKLNKLFKLEDTGIEI